jgi:hypothetical protein
MSCFPGCRAPRGGVASPDVPIALERVVLWSIPADRVKRIELARPAPDTAGEAHDPGSVFGRAPGDRAGKGSLAPEPDIGFIRVRAVAASDEALYVRDPMSNRTLRAKLTCAAEETVAIENR